VPTAVVTGACSYTGRAVAASLLARGWRVRTLTNRVTPLHPLSAALDRAPLQFDDPGALVTFLRGADLFVNTYWIRYPRGRLDFDAAVANSAVLFAAAATAGVPRIVHVSVSNPSASSSLAYYRGKARVEDVLKGLRVSHAIVRPTLVVGPADILVNNIAWFLRWFAVFAMPGSGAYRVQPVALDDVGEIVAEAALASGDLCLDAAGPEVVTFDEFVRAIATAIGRSRPVLHVPPWMSLAALRLLGVVLGEVVLSKQELKGLMEERLVSSEPPRGTTSVLDWLARSGAALGRRYASEVGRHFTA